MLTTAEAAGPPAGQRDVPLAHRPADDAELHPVLPVLDVAHLAKVLPAYRTPGLSGVARAGLAGARIPSFVSTPMAPPTGGCWTTGTCHITST